MVFVSSLLLSIEIKLKDYDPETFKLEKFQDIPMNLIFPSYEICSIFDLFFCFFLKITLATTFQGAKNMHFRTVFFFSN